MSVMNMIMAGGKDYEVDEHGQFTEIFDAFERYGCTNRPRPVNRAPMIPSPQRPNDWRVVFHGSKE